MRKKNYTAYFKVVVDLSIEITAESYEQALEKARKINVRDMVDFDADYEDGSIAVTGMYNEKEEPK